MYAVEAQQTGLSAWRGNIECFMSSYCSPHAPIGMLHSRTLPTMKQAMAVFLHDHEYQMNIENTSRPTPKDPLLVG